MKFCNDEPVEGKGGFLAMGITMRIQIAFIAFCVASLNLYGFAQAATSCTTCHAPVGSTTDFRPVDAAYRNITTGGFKGSHIKHIPTPTTNSAKCTTCHGSAVTSYTTKHRDGNIQIDTAITYSKGASFAQSGNPTTLGSCSTASCHANVYGTGTVTTPVWGATAAGCTACHTTAIATTGPATGSHALHNNTNCADCHTGATNSSLQPTANHIDGNIDVTNGYPANVTKHAAGSGYSSCSTSICHGSSSPVWGANTTNNTCTKCHGTGSTTLTAATEYLIAPSDTTATDTGKVSANPKIGAHQTHLQYFNGLSAQGADAAARCQVCHGTLPVSGNHANGSSAPIFQGLAKKDGTAFTATYNSTTSTCAVYCHNPAGTGGTVASGNAGIGTAPAWNNAAYIADGTLKTQTNCDQCHLSPNGSRAISATYNHSAVTIATDCSSCHGHNGGSGGTTGQQHIDGTLYGAGGSCNGCHDYDTVGATYSGGKWSGGAWGKSGTNFGGYPTVAEGWGAHAKHINHIKTRAGITVAMAAAGSFGSGEAAQVCGTCHTNSGANHNMSGLTGDTTGRMINFGDNTFKIGGAGSSVFGVSNPIYNGISGTSGQTTAKTCSNISCHYFTTPLWSTY